MKPKPNEVYIEHRISLEETGDGHTALSYEEWLEEYLIEMWERHCAPYIC